jgi:hypothetical protein
VLPPPMRTPRTRRIIPLNYYIKTMESCNSVNYYELIYK